jgi:hypothetical protein
LPFQIDIQEIIAILPGDEEFSLDLGPDPQPGKIWGLDQILHLDPEYQIRLVSVRMAENSDNEPGLEFTFQPLKEHLQIREIMVVDPAGGSQLGGGGGSTGPVLEDFRSALFFSGSIPTGKLELNIYSFTLDLRDGWEVTVGE